MPAQNPNVERPCPACGATLKVNAQRLNQKLQCPKCLSVFVLESIAASAKAKPKQASRKKPPAAEPPPGDLASRYQKLLNQHIDLADRYERVVTNYEQLLDDQDKLADQIRQLPE